MPITPRFLDPLVLQEIDDRRWRLVRELRFDSAILAARIVVPEEFVTDLSSVPRLPLAYWLAGDTGRKAAVVHDFLYDHRLGGGRQIADDVFLEALRVEGVPAWRRALMWAAVRLFGRWHS